MKLRQLNWSTWDIPVLLWRHLDVHVTLNRKVQQLVEVYNFITVKEKGNNTSIHAHVDWKLFAPSWQRPHIKKKHSYRSRIRFVRWPCQSLVTHQSAPTIFHSSLTDPLGPLLMSLWAAMTGWTCHMSTIFHTFGKRQALEWGCSRTEISNCS